MANSQPETHLTPTPQSSGKAKQEEEHETDTIKNNFSGRREQSYSYIFTPDQDITLLLHGTDSKAMARGRYMNTAFTSVFWIAKTNYLAIKAYYAALSSEEQEDQHEDVHIQLGVIPNTLQRFREADTNKWMFTNDVADILAHPHPHEDTYIPRIMTQLQALRAGFQILNLLVQSLDTKLRKEPYLTETGGFFDFEEYVGSAGEDGEAKFQKRKMPWACVLVSATGRMKSHKRLDS